MQLLPLRWVSFLILINFILFSLVGCGNDIKPVEVFNRSRSTANATAAGDNNSQLPPTANKAAAQTESAAEIEQLGESFKLPVTRMLGGAVVDPIRDTVAAVTSEFNHTLAVQQNATGVDEVGKVSLDYADDELSPKTVVDPLHKDEVDSDGAKPQDSANGKVDLRQLDPIQKATNQPEESIEESMKQPEVPTNQPQETRKETIKALQESINSLTVPRRSRNRVVRIDEMQQNVDDEKNFHTKHVMDKKQMTDRHPVVEEKRLNRSSTVNDNELPTTSVAVQVSYVVLASVPVLLLFSFLVFGFYIKRSFDDFCVDNVV